MAKAKANANAENTTTQDDAPVATAMERNANFLSSLAGDIRDLTEKVTGATRETLETFRTIGEKLNDAKEVLKDERGAFGKWCEQSGFTFDKTWRARLMKLAANWNEIQQAIEETPDAGRKAFSVDGALSVWDAWKKKQAKADTGDSDGDSEGGDGEPASKKETKAERLARELAEAQARIAELEAEIIRLKTQEAGWEHKPSSGSANGNGTGDYPPSIKPADKAKARKVHSLYMNGGTAGEKASAFERLKEMSARYGMAVEAFIKACGV